MNRQRICFKTPCHHGKEHARQRELCGPLTFKVSRDANKIEIKDAVEKIFKVKVESVRTANFHGKKRRQGRHVGRRPDWKKAYVTLKQGEKMIEFSESV